MLRASSSRDSRETLRKAVGLCVAGFGPFLVGALLVPLRTAHVVASDVILVFVLLVVGAAALGGRLEGALAAAVSTLAYDFFTRPYQSLKVDRLLDLATTVLLLAIGLLVSELVAVGRRARAQAEHSQHSILRILRIHGISTLVAIEDRTVAVTLADQLGASLATRRDDDQDRDAEASGA